MLEGAVAIDPIKYHAFLGVHPMPDSGMLATPKETQGEWATTVSAGAPAQPPQGSATTRATEAPATSGVVPGSSGTECDPTRLYEALGLMTNSLEHLEDGYFSCFKAMVRATREVLVDLNEVDATYVDTILEVMRTWHTMVTLAVTGMHMEDRTTWDAKRDTLDEVTAAFGQVCKNGSHYLGQSLRCPV